MYKIVILEYGNIYKDLEKKYGPIDISFINIGAHNFYPISPYKDKSAYHTNPEEALSIGRDLNSKKIIGTHWGTFCIIFGTFLIKLPKKI